MNTLEKIGKALSLSFLFVLLMATTSALAQQAAKDSGKGKEPTIEQQIKDYPLDTCVVTGQKLGDHGKPIEYNYKGRLIRFCCKGCVTAFEKDPNKYLAMIDEAKKKKNNDATAAPAVQSPTKDEKSDPAKTEPAKQDTAKTEVWTCSMHPEVREPKPGKCPKCGMDLVQAKDTAADKPKK